MHYILFSWFKWSFTIENENECQWIMQASKESAQVCMSGTLAEPEKELTSCMRSWSISSSRRTSKRRRSSPWIWSLWRIAITSLLSDENGESGGRKLITLCRLCPPGRFLLNTGIGTLRLAERFLYIFSICQKKITTILLREHTVKLAQIAEV